MDNVLRFSTTPLIFHCTHASTVQHAIIIMIQLTDVRAVERAVSKLSISDISSLASFTVSVEATDDDSTDCGENSFHLTAISCI